MALPEVTERLSHGEPAWFIRGRTQFVTLADHHHDDRVAFWCAAPAGAQDAFVTSEPERFFIPPYVGHRGWLGVYLDVPVHWDEVAEIVEDAYRTVAPKRLVAALGDARASAAREAPGAAAAAAEVPAPEVAWTFLTNHGLVLLAIAEDPGVRERDISLRVGITERSTQRIVADLIDAGYLSRSKLGRRNVYTVHGEVHMPHATTRHHEVGALMATLVTGSPPAERPATKPSAGARAQA
jgi:hypothetical protein